MRKNLKLIFRDAAQNPVPSPGLTIVIRTDARHATASLKKNIVNNLLDGDDQTPLPEGAVSALDARVEKALHMAYQDWGHNVLGALADCLDYERYGLQQPEDKIVNVHFYNAQKLSQAVTEKAGDLIRKAQPDGGLNMLISLDDLIQGDGEHFSEIAFSRLFTMNGDQQGDYMARPGYKPLDEQLAGLKSRLQDLEGQYDGSKPAIVFLEDNVRHAKMLNWVIGKMEEAGIFEHAKLAGIATCFCCANAAEREKIKCRGETVPVAPVVDYGDAKVDVTTPRDLLFDGFVVQLADHTARLPAVFMDIEKLFKILPSKKEEFRGMVTEANIAFCERLEQEFGIPIPMNWFSVADAVSDVTGLDPSTPMAEVLRRPPQNPQNPGLQPG